jgi:Icc-related predicted phosphoesterase
MVKIIAISDTHLNWDEVKVPDGDIFIHAGDWEASVNQHVRDFNTWLGKLPHRYKIVIAGNHDSIPAMNDKYVKETLTNAIYLNNSGCTIEGLKFWGSPMTPKFGNWWFMVDRNKIKKYWDMIPLDTDVLITHGPPFSILDKPIDFFTGFEGDSCGCLELRNKVNKIKPKVHIFGHIHFSYGTEIKDGTLFVNASVVDEDYKVVNEPKEIEISTVE